MSVPKSDDDASADRSAIQTLADYLSRAGAEQPRRLAGALLREFGTVGRVLSASSARLARVVGPNVAGMIRASRKLVQSSLSERIKSGPVLATSSDLIRYLQLQLGSLRHERVLALYVDEHLRLLRSARISDGSARSASADITRIIQIALDVGASGILVVHNHPSGNPDPSRSDLDWTRRLARVAADLELRLVDHIIVASRGYKSLLHPEASVGDLG